MKKKDLRKVRVEIGGERLRLYEFAQVMQLATLKYVLDNYSKTGKVPPLPKAGKEEVLFSEDWYWSYVKNPEETLKVAKEVLLRAGIVSPRSFLRRMKISGVYGTELPFFILEKEELDDLSDMYRYYRDIVKAYKRYLDELTLPALEEERKRKEEIRKQLLSPIGIAIEQLPEREDYSEPVIKYLRLEEEYRRIKEELRRVRKEMRKVDNFLNTVRLNFDFDDYILRIEERKRRGEKISPVEQVEMFKRLVDSCRMALKEHNYPTDIDHLQYCVHVFYKRSRDRHRWMDYPIFWKLVEKASKNRKALEAVLGELS